MKTQSQRFRTSDTAGFTLTEMMVVIIIVVTLAVLSFSIINKMRNRANDALAVANMRQIGEAIATFASENQRLPRFAGAGVSPALSTANTLTQAYVLRSYLGLPEPTGTIHRAEIFKPPGLKPSNMSGKQNWYELTCYVMYSTNDIHKSKAYLPKGVMADSTGADVGPFGRNGTGGNPSTEGWPLGMLDRAMSKFSSDNGGRIVDLSMIPAMMEINAEHPTIKGSWPWPVPEKPVRGDHVNVLYFDWHVGSVKPDFFFKP